MKKLILISASLLIASPVLANSELEFVGSAPCGFTRVEDFYNSYKYLTNDLGQVKIDVSFENGRNSDDLAFESGSFRTNVINSLAVQGEEIVHTPTGTVCAKLEKGSLAGIPIGKKSWWSKSRCKITTTEAKQKTYDADGFETGKSCTRSFYFSVKAKK